MSISKDNITDKVIDEYQFSGEREQVLVHGLIRHLHAYAREVGLTHSEWRAGLTFLTKAAQFTDEGRNEFSLLSDVMGLSSLVDLLASPPRATPGSVLGPFHVHDSLEQPNGVDLKGEQPGTPTVFEGVVRSADGEPLEALLDFWQNADNALYPKMDATQDYHNLRCKLRTGPDGRFRFRTLLPKPYGIPDDGPVGDLVRAAQRHCMRPAHFHVIVSADGYRPVTTEVFFAGDPYIDSDAVFGVRDALVTQVENVPDPAQALDAGMPTPFSRVRFDFQLVALSAPQA
ncbi:dioxygenase family protein [Hydrogenophaga palleronii]|uniref:dioxygenase family protein n=1 Tax=Hydrogenophaga palleronii TaxID=65655 RepID=UPI0008264092|nr:dioxygenase [Hydrogenophaga palleronii]